jgi:DNA-binding response OmpR family regulator
MAQPANSVLQVDDEAELLEPLRMSLRANGIEVDATGFCG